MDLSSSFLCVKVHLSSTNGRSANLLRTMLPARIPHQHNITHHQQHIVAAASPGRKLSLIQRWRAFKFGVKDKAEQIASVPPVSNIIALVVALRRALQPIYDLLAAINTFRLDLAENYDIFLAQETKQKWMWSKRNKKELEFMDAVPQNIILFAATLLYQVFIPVSLTFALLIPIYYAWVSRDRWWLSPILLASLLMAPAKFLVGANLPYFYWIWPGLI